MALVEQYERVYSAFPLAIVREALERVGRQYRRPRARCAQQIEDINPSLDGDCNQWVGHIFGDQHVPRSNVDPSTDRAILILNSASAEPFITATVNCTEYELAAWDSSMPANFGGDGHAWWKAYYIVPDEDANFVDFDASGSAQYMNWYQTLNPVVMETTHGTYNDGIDLAWVQQLVYGGSGVLTNTTSGTLTSRFNDMIQFFQDYGYRTFDDLTFNWKFHQGTDWNRDGSRFNAIPTPIDWHLQDPVEDEDDHTVTLEAQVVVTPGGFPGAARALATLFGTRLRALCPREVGAPEVFTAPATSITSSGAHIHGEVLRDNGNAITERGFVVGPLSGNAPIKGMSGTNTFVNGSSPGVGTFSQTVGGASSGTAYVYRAYATNSEGTVYGNMELFVTS